MKLLEIKGAAIVVDPEHRRNNDAYYGIVWKVSKQNYAAACAMSNHGLRILLNEEENASYFWPLRKMAAAALVEHAKSCAF